MGSLIRYLSFLKPLLLKYRSNGYPIYLIKTCHNMFDCWLLPERLEWGGPCWQLKLRWMGTQRLQIKGILPCLVRWTRRSGTRDFCPTLAALVSPAQNIFPHRTLFQLIYGYPPPSNVACRRVGSPVSVSVVLADQDLVNLFADTLEAIASVERVVNKILVRFRYVRH